jgi:hypothetical protein
MAREVRTCQFCGNAGSHPEAHIFPRSFYKGEPGVPHALFRIGGVGRVKKSRKGLYDANLWCERCEGDSGRDDDYAAKALLNSENFIPVPGMIDFLGRQLVYKLANADPVKITLFILSVLWRASASRLLEVRSFSLGPYQDRVRDALMTRDPLKVTQFPVIIRRESVAELRSGFIPPSRAQHREFVLFHGGGFEFRAKMTNRRLPATLSNFLIKPGQPILIPRYSLEEIPLGKALAQHVQETERRFGPQARWS